jgi:hypothetical protein
MGQCSSISYWDYVGYGSTQENAVTNLSNDMAKLLTIQMNKTHSVLYTYNGIESAKNITIEHTNGIYYSKICACSQLISSQGKTENESLENLISEMEKKNFTNLHFICKCTISCSNNETKKESSFIVVVKKNNDIWEASLKT